MAELDLRPQPLDLKFARRDSFAVRIRFVNQATGVAIDLTGSALALTVNRSSDGNGQDLFTLALSIVGPATDGIAEFTPSTAQNDLPDGTYYCDVKQTVGSALRTLAAGKWVIGPRITG